MTFKIGDRVRVEFDAVVTDKLTYTGRLQLQSDDGHRPKELVDPKHCTLIKPPATVGPFDPDADYPAGTVVVNDVYGGTAARLSVNGAWRFVESGGGCTARDLAYWQAPTVVHIGRTA